MRLMPFLLLAAPAFADPPSLSLPIACEIGTTCFIEDYFDHAPDPGVQRDFACGFNSRDGHRGTDIAVLGFDAVGRAPVLAAAPGTVLRTRDGMADDRLMRGVTDENACGNAVLLDHGDGWQTLYCHMARDSVAVRPGETLARGAFLGTVGLSGQTTHPHLHLSLTRNGAAVDPFRPEATGTCGPPGGPTLWQSPPPYTPTQMVTAGFSDRVPDLDAIADGSARLPIGAPDQPLVVYTLIGQAEHGDLLVLSASGPDGAILDRSMIVKAPQRAVSRAFGRRAPPGGWPSGDYTGEATLTRAGKVIAHRFAHVSIP